MKQKRERNAETKKKRRKLLWIAIASFVAVLAILFVPIPLGAYDDGGTREYRALTYRIVEWNRFNRDTVYHKTRVYFFSDKNKSIDELWQTERENMEYTFVGTVLETTKDYAVVEPEAGEYELRTCDRIRFATGDLERFGVEVGDIVEVVYRGFIEPTEPAGTIRAIRWKPSDRLREISYTEPWLDQGVADKCNNEIFNDIRITKIYANCFFARTVIPMPYDIKMNGTLSEDWCVGDQVICTYENTYYDKEHGRVEADLLTIEASDWEPDPNACYKPVIYLYPEEETEVSVKLALDGELTCTYPAYKDGWTVTASPDGTLTDAKGQSYNYLYWEGETDAQYDFSKGFCVKGEDTAAFLEEALEQLGLTRREANEFIVFWLPMMEVNPYNLIAFQTDVYTEAAKLTVNPAPDTLLRVFMAWKSAEEFVELPEQELSAPERTGFTVVEWGGTEVK